MLKKITVALIKWYRRDLSKKKERPTCRFYPTCSAYALTAVEDYGAIVGIFLFIKRILRCHPYGGQGVDPVPVRHRKTSKHDRNTPKPDRGYEILSLIREQNRN